MIGSLVSICPAVQYGLLYTRKFEREFLTLLKSDGDFMAKMKISPHLAGDFQWWTRILSNTNQARIFRSGTAIREIFSDASLSG